jgi:hypothetical protein
MSFVELKQEEKIVRNRTFGVRYRTISWKTSFTGLGDMLVYCFYAIGYNK